MCSRWLIEDSQTQYVAISSAAVMCVYFWETQWSSHILGAIR